jgi:predicted amino acid-binding ACT domain protein
MATILSTGEEAQLAQTVEMFEVITQSQPQDYQSLEILKEAYSKLGREKEVIGTSKRIAEAYVQMGQISSAILEYETILQRYPTDAEVQQALRQIESKSSNFPEESSPSPPGIPTAKANTPVSKNAKPATQTPQAEIEDGRRAMHKIFVESKLISSAHFDLYWSTPDISSPPRGVPEPFIQILGDKGLLTVEKSLKLLVDKTRIAFLPLNAYDIDIDLARGHIEEITDQPVAVVAAVGDRMRGTPGIAATVFGALGSGGINVTAISQGSSERNISMVIAEEDAAKAVRALHLAFKLHEAPAGAAH